MNGIFFWITVFRFLYFFFKNGHEWPEYPTTEPFHPLLWVRVNLSLLSSGRPGVTLVKFQCPVTLNPYKPQSGCFSYEATSLLLMTGLPWCLYFFLIGLNLLIISQTYFSSLIKTKIRKTGLKYFK